MLLRWLMITLVLTGVIAMHVLGAHDDGGHGPIIEPASAAAEHSEHSAPATHLSTEAPAGIGAVASPADSGGHGGSMATCILFLIAGVGSLLLALALAVRRRGQPLPRIASIATTAIAPRGPPRVWHSRISLCVLRV